MSNKFCTSLITFNLNLLNEIHLMAFNGRYLKLIIKYARRNSMYDNSLQYHYSAFMPLVKPTRRF